MSRKSVFRAYDLGHGFDLSLNLSQEWSRLYSWVIGEGD